MNNRHLRVIGSGALAVGAALLNAAPAAAQMTEVGTPRAETLIVDMLNGTVTNPQQMNPYLSGTDMVSGVNQLLFSPLWEIDTSTGTMFPFLAAEMPEPLNDDLTMFRFKLREGITWSDGETFDADDVIYTADMLLATESLPARGVIVDNLQEMVKIDQYTVEVTTTKPMPRFEKVFGSVIFGPQFRIVPEHVFKDQDPATYLHYPPVTTGPYVLEELDPNGNWFLWTRRDDWEDSDLAVLRGMPQPKHILFRFYGPEEKRVLAMIQGELDVLMDISADSWDILRKRYDQASAWFDNFPYANLDDPCERGIHFNTARPPYDKWEVRWALVLATGIEDVSMNTFSGALRVSPLAVPPIQILMETYHIPMTGWLKGFELPDGYKPFDDGTAIRIAEILRGEGIEGLPESDEELRSLFGVGWWKKDYEQAGKLLESVGFSKDADGSWLLPDGSPWRIVINAPVDFEVQSQRLAFAVANEWNKFGIQTSVQQMQGGPFWTNYNTGDFEVGSYWWPSSCAVAPDLFHNIETWHQRYVVPNGVATGNNRERFSTQRISDLIDEVTALPSEDPRTVEIWTEVLKELVIGMPAIDMVGTSKFVPVSTEYWTNFPDADNYYEGPWWWWTQFKIFLAEIRPAS